MPATVDGRLELSALDALDENPRPIEFRAELVKTIRRHPDRPADLTDLRVEVIAGDLADDTSVEAAIREVPTVILVTAPVLDYELRVITAATRTEVAHVIKITSSASPDSPIARPRDQSVIEAALIASGLDHTLLRNNVYMQNLLMLAPAIAKTSQFASSAGAGRIGFLDARDAVAVAVAGGANIAAAPGCAADALSHNV